MNLSEFISKVGDANVSFQLLNDCMTDIKTSKKHNNLVTFGTKAITPNDVMANTGKVGMVVWVDRDRWTEVTKSLPKE